MTAECPPFDGATRGTLESKSDSVDWDELVDEVTGLDDVISNLPLGSGAGTPTIENGERFVPYGWAGNFKGDVKVPPVNPDSDKDDYIDEPMYNEFIGGARRVAGTYGLRTATAHLSLMPQAVRDMRTTYLWYSRRLIQLTERLYDSRLPVTIERKTHVGYELRGSPDFARSVTEQARGTGRVASREISFSIITPVTRLLAIFHREMAGKLTMLTNEIGLDDPLVKQRRQYHEEVRQERLLTEVVNAAPSENIPTPEELDQMRASQFETVRKLTRLWLGYQRSQAPELDWQDRFDTAVKPVQRVYELWCLEQILDVLTDAFGTDTLDPSGGSPIPTQYDFPEAGVSLFYDRSVRSINDVPASQYAGPAFRKSGKEVGKPDFLISEHNTPVWVADAKFQLAHKIGTSGLYRFFGYVVDYLSPHRGQAALLCAAGDPIEPTTEIEGRPTQTIATMDDQSGAQARIADSIDGALSTDLGQQYQMNPTL